MVSGGRRTSTVRCFGICELSVLTRASLEQLTKEFPGEVVNVQKNAKSKMAQMKVIDQMTFLLAKAKLSSETRALIVISNYARRWKHHKQRKALEALNGPSAVAAAVVHEKGNKAAQFDTAAEWEQKQKNHMAYKLVLQKAWVDGDLIDDGGRMRLASRHGSTSALNAAQAKYGVSQELHSKLREEVLQNLSESHSKISAIPGNWGASGLESSQKSGPAAERSGSKLVREELDEESRQGLNEVQIQQVVGLEEKLNAILAALTRIERRGALGDTKAGP
jgi:hypothetical protein